MERPRKRYYAGVCGALGTKYKINPILIRLLFVITTFFTMCLSILIYFVLCFTIPNFQRVDKKQKTIKGLLWGFYMLLFVLTLYFIGYVIISAIMSWDSLLKFLLGFVLSFIILMTPIFIIILIVFGYVKGRSLVEIKENIKAPILNTEY